MSTSPSPRDEALAPAVVLDWVIPRPTGRWHQSFVVTHNEIWITPEISFAEHQQMTAAAADSIISFMRFVRDAGWLKAQQCSVGDVKGLNWDNVTGWMRLLASNERVLGAMIPNRGTGDKLEPKLKSAIAAARQQANA